jgi:hypothetical protein
MDRYRLRIVLLSLGVLFGFGSAFAHFSGYRHHHRSHHHHADCWDERSAKPEPTPDKL